MAHGKALVVGASGISGYNTAAALLAQDWEVDGLSRRGGQGPEGMGEVLVDLQDRDAVASALRDGGYTHVFYCSWLRQETEAENRRVNGAMLSNVLDAVGPGGTLAHVALVTGLKHYLGPFEAYAQTPIETPFREEMDRVPYENFYYDQEDILFAAAVAHGFTWSVHRSHTMIGWAVGNAMNMGMTLAIYGTICREAGTPMVFPGSPQQYEGVTDVTDARLLAQQLIWSATTPAGANQALNTVNGDVFRWRQMWELLAADLGAQTGPYPGHGRSLEEEMRGRGEEWDAIVARHGLAPHPMDRLASWWHTDSDLGREVETFADMTKSRTLGFLGFRDTRRTFLDLFQKLREERIIPPLA
jgi:nucleoside-diphosphate-sugar epimerase